MPPMSTTTPACPHIRSSREGTNYCALGESGMKNLEKHAEALRLALTGMMASWPLSEKMKCFQRGNDALVAYYKDYPRR